MPAVQLELPFSVIDGGKPEPYMNFRKRLEAELEQVLEEGTGSNGLRDLIEESLPNTG